MSRLKSFKKSLRDSFRRRRRPRSPQVADGSPKKETTSSPPKEGAPTDSGETAGAPGSDEGKKSSAAKSPPQKRELPAVEIDDEAEKVERAVEARSEKTDTLNSMIRAAVFAKTYLVNCKSFFCEDLFHEL